MSSPLLLIFGKNILDHIYEYDSTYKNKDLIHKLNCEIFSITWMKTLLNSIDGYGINIHCEHILKVLMQILKNKKHDIINNGIFPSNLVDITYFGKHLFMSYSEVDEFAIIMNEDPNDIDSWWIEYIIDFKDISLFITMKKWYFARKYSSFEV